MGLSNFDINKLVEYLNIPDFKGVFARDELSDQTPNEKECAIVNFNKSGEHGSHWVCFYKDGDKRIYFDSFGCVAPIEIQKYLKTPDEFATDKAVILRNTDIVQKYNTTICGHLCLYVLDSLSKGANFQDIIDSLKW